MTAALRNVSLARLIVVSAIFYYALHLALQYGGIWQSQAEPARDVEVTLSDGRTVLTGTLWRPWSSTWSKDWVLETQDGRQWHFQNYAVMRFKPSAQGGPFSERSHWRTLLPAGVVVCAWFAWLLQGCGILRSAVVRRAD